ncbi:hypothetical protein NHQ30_009743 [Ciborinia camelliae]|nr:hypothetical protein NHQ30_009743 [Ciborinia camelliae]
MEPLTNRFSVLEIEDVDQEIEDELVPQHESPVAMPHKRTSKSYNRHRNSHKKFVIKKPPFLRIPLELRWMVLDQLVALNTEIEISPSTIDSFHALRLTTKGLREEVKEWAKKRPDIVNDFPYGYYIPSETTFILKIDHRWKKRFANKTVSGSHVTFKRSKTQPRMTVGTRAITHITREKAWHGFCSTLKPENVARMHLKFEISLSDEFSPRHLTRMSQEELCVALSAATYYHGGPWASMRLFVHGTLDQLSIINDPSMFLQVRDLLHVTQKTHFDEETWEQFRDSNWPDDDYDALEYPIEVSYWEDEHYKISKWDKTNAEIYEYGGKVMEFKIKSAEDMRRGPVPEPFPQQKSTAPADDDFLESENELFDSTLDFLPGGCL